MQGYVHEDYVDAPALIDLEFLSAVSGLLGRKLVTRGGGGVN